MNTRVRVIRSDDTNSPAVGSTGYIDGYTMNGDIPVAFVIIEKTIYCVKIDCLAVIKTEFKSNLIEIEGTYFEVTDITSIEKAPTNGTRYAGIIVNTDTYSKKFGEHIPYERTVSQITNIQDKWHDKLVKYCDLWKSLLSQV